MRARLVATMAPLLLVASAAGAADHPIAHRLSLSRYSGAGAGMQFKLVAGAGEGGNPAAFAIPADPRAAARFIAVERDGGSLVDPLTAGEWTGLGEPAGSRGWKYRNRRAPDGGAVAVLMVSERAVKIVARSTGGMPLPAALNGELRVYAQLAEERYCAEAVPPHAKEVSGRLIRSKDQSAPPTCAGACPFGPDVDADGISDCSLPIGTVDQVLVDPARGREVGARVVYPRTTVGSHPVVLISHGGLGAASGEVLFDHIGTTLAAGGFVAVQIGHRASPTIEQHRLDRPADVSFLIDALASAALALPPDFGGTLDTTRVGHTGHSAGAYTAHAVAGATYPFGTFTDGRVAAIAPISPQGVGDVFAAFDNGPDDNTWRSVLLPVFVLLGADELDVNGVGTFIETDWRLRPFLRYPAFSDRLQVILTGQEHLDMGSQGSADVKAFVAHNVRAFFDRYLRGRGDACAIGALRPPATGIDRHERLPADTGSALSACAGG